MKRIVALTALLLCSTASVVKAEAFTEWDISNFPASSLAIPEKVPGVLPEYCSPDSLYQLIVGPNPDPIREHNLHAWCDIERKKIAEELRSEKNAESIRRYRAYMQSRQWVAIDKDWEVTLPPMVGSLRSFSMSAGGTLSFDMRSATYNYQHEFAVQCSTGTIFGLGANLNDLILRKALNSSVVDTICSAKDVFDLTKQ